MTVNNLKEKISILLQGVILSYAQVFFSKNVVYAFLLIIVTFFDPVSGFSGLLAVLTANLVALWIGFDKQFISRGYYGFNSLLVGLGIGAFFKPGLEFFGILVFAAILTFFFTIWFEGILRKYGLPYLSWPFLICIWMVSLAARNFESLQWSDRGIFLMNEIYRYGGMDMVNLYHWFNDLPVHPSINVYFRSLAAILFQYNLAAGILIATGLLIFSRIGFLLSIIGFYSAWLYYQITGADLSQLNYSYIGFNFIFTSLALGGFFVVPSRYSILWSILLIPLNVFILGASEKFFTLLDLPVYSLGFNILALVFLYVLKSRQRYFKQPELVYYQHFSPENNLYAQHNYQLRFDTNVTIHIVLPFLDEWTVTQGHNGEYTHREEWKHAWDFEIHDEKGKSYSADGNQLSDYYCFGKPVLAPADGWIVEVVDGIPDNPVGEINIAQNWGNTIIIKHNDWLYSKLSHLKQGSIVFAKGAFVKRGQIVAQCGNSGRSPYPHLHFQIQSNPYIGSPTIDYPIANYLATIDGLRQLKIYDRPLKNQKVSNILPHEVLQKAFNLIPGQIIAFKVKQNDSPEKTIYWDVKIDMYRNTFLECRQSNSRAYFYNEGNLFYFTAFEGNKQSLLYYFYLGAFKVLLGFYPEITVTDLIPLNAFRITPLRILQDFIAPFYIFLKGNYSMKYVKINDNMISASIEFVSESSMIFNGRTLQKTAFHMVIQNGRFDFFQIKTSNMTIVANEIPV